PHIIDISDFGETDDGSTYFAMEYLDGKSLGTTMEERGALPVEMVCDIALQLCDGLAAAHRQNIIHRDLKPDNVTLIKQGKTDPFCKILDFGIAKVSTGTSSTKLTMQGAVFGTPHYMSPEQAAGATIDHRTDIYSLGVMMYEMVSGKLPFNADNFMGILTQHMYKAPVPIRALVGCSECPPGLEALILKCLSKKQDARYGTTEELADDIRKFMRDGAPNAVQEMMARSGSFNVPVDYFKGAPGALAKPQGPRSRLGPRLAVLAGVLAAVGVVLFVIMRGSMTTAAPEPETTETAPPERTAEASASAKPSRTIEVLVYATPPGAVALIDGREVPLPETFPITEGEPKRIEVRAAAHESQVIELDGSNSKVAVNLKPTSPKAGVRYPPPKSVPGKAKTPSKTGADVVNPWDH
ncbi:MAG TPA: protein kinase, partial [Polyangiaceae bacterium]|nr:protein kinase [Polyangiaceae bacterium]